MSATDWNSVRADLDTVPESGGRTYSLLGADRRLYRSAAPGRFGGHRKSRIYGRLDCPAALRAIVGGGYAAHRVFFADEQTAVAAGYRPCAVCLPGAYAAWESPMTMTTTHSRPAVVSPRVPEPTLARYPAATRAPQPHTAAELDRLIRMLRASRAETIAIGRGRHTASAGAADALAAAWILADTPAGCAQLASRLTGQPGWTPGRTFGFASVATPDLLALTPPGVLAGMTGATAAGGSWRIEQGLLLVNDDPEGATP